MLVATGRDGNGNEKNYTQVVDLSLTNVCETFPAYPISMYGAAGGLINNILTVCGGRDSSNNYHLDTCYKYDMAANEWTHLCNMQSKRDFHATATLPDNTLWITGKDIVCRSS